MSKIKRHAIIVLGMHRSGTSALAGALGMLGMRLPDRLMPPSIDNPKGYFESVQIYEIHERLLAAAGTNWSGVESLPEDWFHSTEASAFVDELVAAVWQDYTDAATFVVKDPRMCRLMPLWRRVLDEVGAQARFAIPIRNPLEVARSLEKRDGLPLAHGCLLWLRHMLEAERETRGSRRVFVHYHDLLSDPARVAALITSQLTQETVALSGGNERDISSLIDPELRHHVVEPEELKNPEAFYPWLWEAYEAFAALVERPADTASQRRLDRVRALFDPAVASFAPLLAARETAMAERDTNIAALERKLAEREAKAATLDHLLSERNNEIARFVNERSEQDRQFAILGQAIAKRDRKVTILGQDVAERDGRIAALDHAIMERDAKITILEQSLTDRDARLSALGQELIETIRRFRNSWSWRVSMPIRVLGSFARRLSPIELAELGPITKIRDTFTRLRMKIDEFTRGFRLLNSSDRVRLLASIVRGDLKSGKAIIRSALLTNDSPQSYDVWVKLYDTLSNSDKKKIRRQIDEMPSLPMISVIMPVFDTVPKYLEQALESIVNQLYPNWELCIADDQSTNPKIKNILRKYEKSDHRIKVAYRSARGHISASMNSALELASGEFVALVDHDDVLPPHALYLIAEEILTHPNLDICYTDEDKIDDLRRRFDPHFKSGWNPELFFSQNYIAHLGVYRTSIARKIGGFREGFEGSQDYDFILRFLKETGSDRIRHIPHVLYHWRIYPGVSSFSTGNASKSISSAERALKQYFSEVDPTAEVVGVASFPGWWRVKRRLTVWPRVSLIIPTRDKLDLLSPCIDGLLNRTDYPDFEIVIVDNGSVEEDTIRYFEELKRDSRVKVIRLDVPFNYSLLNNYAVKKCSGSIVGFLNNDIDVIHSDWLQEMVSQLEHKNVGAVGAKLYYSNDTIQHAGVTLGVYGVAAHSHRHFDRRAVGYFGRPILIQNLSAVTAACMITKKDLFERVGGFNEVDLPVGYNDVDLCLKIRELGYNVVFTPFAELYHRESASRGPNSTPQQIARDRQERQWMIQRWGDVLADDPFYNPNLTIETENFGLAFPPRATKPWRTRPPAAGGDRWKRDERLELVCPFHHGDVLLAIQVAAQVDELQQCVRLHVCESLVPWVNDFEPRFPVASIPLPVANARETQDSLVKALSYVSRRSDISDWVVRWHPEKNLSDTANTLLGSILQRIGIQGSIKITNRIPLVTGRHRRLALDLMKKFEGKAIIIHPVGGWSLKTLPPHLLSELQARVNRAGFKLVQIGGAADLRSPYCDDAILLNETPSQWRAIFECAPALIGVDSWSAHFATILDMPQITLYGSTHPMHIRSKPYFLHQSKPALTFASTVACSPCNSLACLVYPAHAYCAGYNINETALDAFLAELKERAIKSRQVLTGDMPHL